jgi:hypothetical protein
VLEDQIKGKHGVLRTKWRWWVAPGEEPSASVTEWCAC